jgi:hypothetical protein
VDYERQLSDVILERSTYSRRVSGPAEFISSVEHGRWCWSITSQPLIPGFGNATRLFEKGRASSAGPQGRLCLPDRPPGVNQALKYSVWELAATIDETRNSPDKEWARQDDQCAMEVAAKTIACFLGVPQPNHSGNPGMGLSADEPGRAQKELTSRQSMEKLYIRGFRWVSLVLPPVVRSR